MVTGRWLKWLFVVSLATALLVILACLGVQSWLQKPKVMVSDVQEKIGNSLPIGTPRQDVDSWLTSHSMPATGHHDPQGHPYIESWISDSGPRSEWPFGIRDIRLQFFFDKDQRLIRFSLNEEDRF
jgi:hypothetical protein